MSAVQLHCPHCGGLFQTDVSLSGQHVSCPLCANVVALPDLASAAPEMGESPPPPPPPEYAPPPPEIDEAFQLGCPICGGAFQATRAMSGQQIACPHCNSAVMMPEFQPSGAAPPPTGWEGQYEPAPPAIPPPGPYGMEYAAPPLEPSFLPPEPGFAPQPYYPNDAAEFSPAGYSPQPPPFEASAPVPLPAQSIVAEDDLLPPSVTRPPADAPARTEEQPPQRDDASPRDPPAVRKSKGKRKTVRLPQAETDDPADLLPPGAAPQKAVDAAPDDMDQLPPAAKPKKRKRSHRPAPASTDADVESLLPPGAAATSPDIPEEAGEKTELDEQLPPAAETVSKPKSPSTLDERDVTPASGQSDGSLLVPMEDGGYVALREPVKTIAVHGRQIELKRLSPEEKGRRRFVRNVFVAGFGMVFLIVAALVAAYFRF